MKLHHSFQIRVNLTKRVHSSHNLTCVAARFDGAKRSVAVSLLVFASFCAVDTASLTQASRPNLLSVTFHDNKSCSRFDGFQEGFGLDELIRKEKLCRLHVTAGTKSKTRDHPIICSTTVYSKLY